MGVMDGKIVKMVKKIERVCIFLMLRRNLRCAGLFQNRVFQPFHPSGVLLGHYLTVRTGLLSDKLQEISIVGFSPILSTRFPNLKKMTVKLDEPHSVTNFINSVKDFQHLKLVRAHVQDLETLKTIERSLLTI